MCKHKVIRIAGITGDPLKHKYMCIKCGEMETENIMENIHIFNMKQIAKNNEEKIREILKD